jgi:hypothetical protein
MLGAAPAHWQLPTAYCLLQFTAHCSLGLRFFEIPNPDVAIPHFRSVILQRHR